MFQDLEEAEDRVRILNLMLHKTYAAAVAAAVVQGFQVQAPLSPNLPGCSGATIGLLCSEPVS